MSKILVVEDSVCIRTLVSINLISNGHQVVTAADGSTAIAHLFNENRKEDIALIILDLNLPDLSGMQIMEMLSQDSILQNIPIVVMSGDEMDNPLQYPGIAATLLKPFRIQQFLKIVQSIIEEQNEKTACPCNR